MMFDGAGWGTVQIGKVWDALEARSIENNNAFYTLGSRVVPNHAVPHPRLGTTLIFVIKYIGFHTFACMTQDP